MLKFHPLACVNKTKDERKDVICGSSEHVVCFRVHSADLAYQHVSIPWYCRSHSSANCWLLRSDQNLSLIGHSVARGTVVTESLSSTDWIHVACLLVSLVALWQKKKKKEDKDYKKRSKNAHMSLWTMEETRTEWKDPQFKAHTFFDLKGIYVCPKLWYNFSQNSGRGKRIKANFIKFIFHPTTSCHKII